MSSSAASRKLKAIKKRQSKAKKGDDEESDDAVSTPQWMGNAIKSSKDGLNIYPAFRKGGEVFKRGDGVCMKNPDENGKPYLGRLDRLFEDAQGHMCVLINWMYYPEETPLKKADIAKLHPREVFASDNSDVNYVAAVDSKCEILEWADYMDRKNDYDSDDDDLYVYRRFYDDMRRKFKTIEGNETEKELSKKLGGKGTVVVSGGATDETDEATLNRGLGKREGKVMTSTGGGEVGGGEVGGGGKRKRRGGGRSSEEEEDEEGEGGRKRQKGVGKKDTKRSGAKGKKAGRSRTATTSTTTTTNTTTTTTGAVNTLPMRTVERRIAVTALEQSRAALHVSAVPEALPCREAQYAQVYELLETKLRDNVGGCIYVSGVPGTGKTATVHEVVRALERESQRDDDDDDDEEEEDEDEEVDGESDGSDVDVDDTRETPKKKEKKKTKKKKRSVVPPFKFAEINCMKLTDPHQAYVQLWHAIKGDYVTPKHAEELLEKTFSTPNPRRHSIVVLLDELDQLVTRKQSVMYNLFDWPHQRHARLIVIAIANTMDLPERVMTARVQSRLGPIRLTFAPYNHEQLMRIIYSRVEPFGSFDRDAIQLCARKVAAISGDARRALDICRRAAELAEADTVATDAAERDDAESVSSVQVTHIHRATDAMFASPIITAIRNASLHERILLLAIAREFSRTGIEEVHFGKILPIHGAMCITLGIDAPPAGQLQLACMRLGATRLLLVDSASADVYQRIRSNVSVDDIKFALSEDPQLKQQSTDF